MDISNFNASYIGLRNDLLRFIPFNAKKVLDVGCSTGQLGLDIKQLTNAEVIGIELSKEMAEVAAQRIDKVIVGDIEKIECKEKLKDSKFDIIILADVLEHLKDPWLVLKTIKDYLEPQGQIIASIPNIRHINTIFNLVFKGYWPYRERGIHDKTHLRFFTKKNILELFENAGLNINEIETNYRIIERPHRFNRFARSIAMPGIKSFLAFQYLVQANLK